MKIFLGYNIASYFFNNEKNIITGSEDKKVIIFLTNITLRNLFILIYY